MPAKYKLTYFNAKGRAEMTRLLFAAKGVEFEDCRLNSEEWAKLKPDTPQGVLPILDVDGKIRLSQSFAIARFVAREVGLYGKTNLEAAYIDQILDTVLDLINAIMPVFFEKDEAKKAELKKKFDDEDLPKIFGHIEKAIGTFGKDGFAVSNSISLADIVLYSTIDFLTLKDQVAKFPKIAANAKKVEADKNIAKYLKERPVTSR